MSMSQLTQQYLDRLEEISKTAIDPAMELLPAQMDSIEARLMLLAIGLQESRFAHRFQVVSGKPGAKGPARGFWQFERGTRASRGGVWGVFLHPASRYWLSIVCAARGCDFDPMVIWQRVETDDVLAAAVARLLLFTDAAALPRIGERDQAWHLYARRTWRPGKPHPQTWPDFYEMAMCVVGATV